jgi:serine protease Do
MGLGKAMHNAISAMIGSPGVMLLKPRRIIIAVGLALAVSICGTRAGYVSGNQADVVRSILPAVVNITVRKRTPEPVSADASAHVESGEDSKIYVGSGFVIDPSGIIVTNYHVVQQAFDIAVTFSDGAVLPGELLRASRMADIAVLRVHADHPLTPAAWGDSDKLRLGDEVFAIGNALGIGMSVTGGIVSGLNRDLQDSPYDHYIQTDAAINHGNSGGPLCDMSGQVVGVDTEMVSPTEAFSGLGLAIPSNSARFVVDQLLKYGWVHPGWIGVKVQQVTPEMAEAMGLPRVEGSVVSWVNPNGPAQKAGIAVSDVILSFGADTARDERALLRDIAHTPTGEKVPVTILRDGVLQTIPVTIGLWPRDSWDRRDAPEPTDQPNMSIPPDLGLTLASIPAGTRAKPGLDTGTRGVLISEVAAGSDAARRGLAPGDVILRVQDRTVATPADVQRAIAAARAAGHRFIVVLVQQKTPKVPGPAWLALALLTPG